MTPVVRDLSLILPALGNSELYRQFGIVTGVQIGGLVLVSLMKYCDLGHVTTSSFF